MSSIGRLFIARGCVVAADVTSCGVSKLNYLQEYDTYQDLTLHIGLTQLS